LAKATDLLARLRTVDVVETIGTSGALMAEWQASGVRFAASSPQMEAQYARAVGELFGAIKQPRPILHEGGVYQGC
jgi:hypothetical protein